MDCDCMFIDMSVRLEQLIIRSGIPSTQALLSSDKSTNTLSTIDDKLYLNDPYFIISEDGRGLAGGNWFIKNKPESVSFLYSLLNPVYDIHTLRDQFSILYTVLRKGAFFNMNDFVSCYESREKEKRESTNNEKREGESSNLTRPTLCELGYQPYVRLLPQKYINSYPWSLCRPSHHCFEDNSNSTDFIVSFITLSHLSRDVAFSLLESFSERGKEVYKYVAEHVGYNTHIA